MCVTMHGMELAIVVMVMGGPRGGGWGWEGFVKEFHSLLRTQSIIHFMQRPYKVFVSCQPWPKQTCERTFDKKMRQNTGTENWQMSVTLDTSCVREYVCAGV